MESFKTLSNAYKGLPLRGCWEFLIVGLMYCHNAKKPTDLLYATWR
jgi:hypothetical protein